MFLADGEDTRMRMFGAPTGYEFVSLVEAILIAGTGQRRAEDSTLKLIAADDKPTQTAGLQHADLTALSQGGRPGAQDGVRSTRTSPRSRSTPPSSWICTRRFRVTGVPKTIVNGTIEIMGALPEDPFVRTALRPARRDPADTPTAAPKPTA